MCEIRPILLAICRDCIGEPAPSKSCWRCAGGLQYLVDDEGDADFVFGIEQQGAGFELAMRPTERFQAWMRELREA